MALHFFVSLYINSHIFGYIIYLKYQFCDYKNHFV